MPILSSGGRSGLEQRLGRFKRRILSRGQPMDVCFPNEAIPPQSNHSLGRCFRSSSGRSAARRNTGDKVPAGILCRFAGARRGKRYGHTGARNDGTGGAAPLSLENIDVPALICASWSDHGLHTRGSIEGFTRISSRQKWLYTHGRTNGRSITVPRHLSGRSRSSTIFSKEKKTASSNGLASGWRSGGTARM